MKIDECVPVWKWTLQKGPLMMSAPQTGRLLGALIRLLAGCFSPEDQRRDTAHNGEPPLSCFITDADKTNLHRGWDMIINVLINEYVTFKDINELWFRRVWWFPALLWSSMLLFFTRWGVWEAPGFISLWFHLQPVFTWADPKHSRMEIHLGPRGGRFPAIGNIHPGGLWVWSFSPWVAPLLKHESLKTLHKKKKKKLSARSDVRLHHSVINS